LLKVSQFRVDSKEVEGMTEDQLPAGDGVEVVKDLGRELRVNAEEIGGRRCV